MKLENNDIKEIIKQVSSIQSMLHAFLTKKDDFDESSLHQSVCDIMNDIDSIKNDLATIKVMLGKSKLQK